jgi:hypothetical protein
MASTESASSAAPSAPSTQDVQTLIGLLNGLMPLLQRVQSAGQAGLSWPEHTMFVNPVLEHRAAVNLVENMTTDTLRGLSAYLEANSERWPALEAGGPLVAQAERLRMAGEYAQAFNLIYECYRAIALLRAADPQMPDLRPAEPGSEPRFAKAASPKTTSPPH